MTTILVTALLINCQVEQVSKRGLSSLLLSYTYALFFFSFLLQQDAKIYTNVVPTFFSNFFLKFLIFFFLECDVGRGGCVNHHGCLRIQVVISLVQLRKQLPKGPNF